MPRGVRCTVAAALSSERVPLVIEGDSPSALYALIERQGHELAGGPVRYNGRWAVAVYRTGPAPRPRRARWWLLLLLVPAVGGAAALLGWFMSGPGPMLILACLATFGLSVLVRRIRS